MEEKISIVIPVYNNKNYLSECLESVINQTYRNLEIICIDDGSTDGSSEILDEFAKQDSRLIVIHKVNEGVSATRNVGLNIASGSYIGFVDSDDFCEPDMFEELLRQIKENHADVVVCSFVGREISDAKKIELFTGEQATAELVRGKLFGGHLPNKLIKKELIGSKRLEPDIIIFEDLLFLTRIIYKANNVVFYNKGLYHYRYNGASALHSNVFKRSYLTRLTACDRIEQFVQDTNIDCNDYLVEQKLHTYYDIVKKISTASNKKNFKKEYTQCLKAYRSLYRYRYLSNRTMKEKILFMLMKYSMPLYRCLFLLRR